VELKIWRDGGIVDVQEPQLRKMHGNLRVDPCFRRKELQIAESQQLQAISVPPEKRRRAASKQSCRLRRSMTNRA
jgi:hypothetical protein